MKKEDYTVTFSVDGEKGATITGDQLHFLVRAMKKVEPVNDCPRCHRVDFYEWKWLKLTMRKCFRCGRIWCFEKGQP